MSYILLGNQSYICLIMFIDWVETRRLDLLSSHLRLAEC